MSNKFIKLNSTQLLEYQPNRYPFLFIDTVTKVVPGKIAIGYKNFTNNEWFFPKHFPGHANVPGVITIEALAQMMTVAITTLPGNKGKITIASSYKVKFLKEILPGDKLEIEAKVLSWKRGVCEGVAKGIVSGNVVVDCEMTLTIPNMVKKFLPKK